MKLRATVKPLFVAFACVMSLTAGHAGMTAVTFSDGALSEGSTDRTVLFDRVALAPILIEPRPFAGTRNRPDEAEVLGRLSDEATKQAARILVRIHIAGSIERLSSADAPTTAPVIVTGTVVLPISLPPNVYGFSASGRRGHFATAHLVISDIAAKTILAEVEATCDWRDARWTYGGPHGRYNSQLDSVLEHFVRKTTERAVRRLKETTAAHPAEGGGG